MHRVYNLSDCNPVDGQLFLFPLRLLRQRLSPQCASNSAMWRNIVSRLWRWCGCGCCIGSHKEAQLTRSAASTLTLDIVIVDEDLQQNSPLTNALEMSPITPWPNLMVL